MINQKARIARKAAIQMAMLDTAAKDAALDAVVDALYSHQEEIVLANQQDIDQARKEHISSALLKRLVFDRNKLADTVKAVESVISLPDPVGKTLAATELDKGLLLRKVSCPIGVLGVIFEARPDALVQIATLALKSGNAVLLKGGSEASNTNSILADIIANATEQAGLPAGWVQLLESRSDVNQMLGLDEYIDLIVPRGSNAFVRYIMDNTRIAVLGHADGICHVYIDKGADIKQAVKIAYDAKCQYPAVCNAMETLLIHKEVADDVLPLLKRQYDDAGVELRGDEKVRGIIDCKAASDADWVTEYNELILSIRIVDNLDRAIEHINTYGSHHTDAIVTTDANAAGRFMDMVDSANVFWNCSTRFADGYRYGLGAELGISTGKLHARGPVGLEGMVSYKWKLAGTGQVVSDYASGKKQFTHKPIVS